MKNLTVATLSVLALGIAGCHTVTTPTTVACSPPPTALVTVPVIGQHTSMWCWAASGEMTMNYHGASVTQCDEANKQFGMTTCCASTAGCVTGGWPEYPKYGFSSVHTTNAPLTWNQLRGEIYCQKRPFAFSWHWIGDGGHMMVVSGYDTIAGVNYVRVNNPWPWDPSGGGAQYFTTYDDYVSGPDHTHWDDYHQIHN
ncbi:MAG: papain-like cysteine protease family protein [Acidobacteriota bacterium]